MLDELGMADLLFGNAYLGRAEQHREKVRVRVDGLLRHELLERPLVLWRHAAARGRGGASQEGW